MRKLPKALRAWTTPKGKMTGAAKARFLAKMAAGRRKKGKKPSAKFERCVKAVKKHSRGKVNPWAVCHASVGRDPSITHSQISTLRREAAEAGDRAMVAICERALRGDKRAIAECYRVLREARAHRDPSSKKVRREVGPTGAAAWHFTNHGAHQILYWGGPGSRLRTGPYGSTSLVFIDHPSADGNYRTLKEADAAAKRFLKELSGVGRDPGKHKDYMITGAHSFTTKGPFKTFEEAKAAAKRMSSNEEVAVIGRDGYRAVEIGRAKGGVYRSSSGRDPSSPPPSGIRRHTSPTPYPTEQEYTMREARELHKQLQEIEKAPLAVRKEAAAEWLDALKTHPHIVAERIGWILNGSYGKGAYDSAWRTMGMGPRANKGAALSLLVAALEWRTPQRMAIAQWKKLTAAEQAHLRKLIDQELKEATP